MFDLEEQLRRWRQETETTLAFEPEEIDELEDHLRFSLEQALMEGATPEETWRRALHRLGPSPSLAPEFAKSKLMPALFHLLRTWWRPGLLLILFGVTFPSMDNMNWPWPAGQGEPKHNFLIISWLSFVVLVLLLPSKASKNAVLLGTGNAFYLIPLLHLAFYNSLTDHLVGAGWTRMAASFGWLPISLSVIGIIFLNSWWWVRSRDSRQGIPAMAAVAGVIVFLLAVSPFTSELVGNLSIRDLYSMPTAHDITLTGEAKSDFLRWKFVDVLIDCLIVITTWLPLVLAVIGSIGILSMQGILRYLKVGTQREETVFPAQQDLPWIMTLAGSGVGWIIASFVEPPFNAQFLQTETGGHHVSGSHIGAAFLPLAPTLLFLVCGYELTKRLGRALSLRPFYASMLVVGEAVVLVSVILMHATTTFPTWTGPQAVSAEPAWLSVALGLVVVLMASLQVLLIGKKARSVPCQPSLWKFDGGDLVQFGLLLGLIFAYSGLILMMVALVLAFESTAMISALIDWGDSVEHPLTKHFDPLNYPSPPAMVTQVHYPTPHLDFWIFSGLTYVSFCLAVGLLVAVILSGLEFIRFNSYRYYKMRKADREHPSILAVNE
jgi:hypothetical protein